MPFESKINFEILRYANCWEDADILLKGLAPKPHSIIISIASAGDNCFSLLTTEPKKLIAVDVNKTQLYLCELKIAGFKTLEHDNFLSFLGVKSDKNRLDTYQNILRPGMTPDAASYWDRHKKAIEKGVIFAGKFEKYLNFFAGKLLPFIHGRASIQKLLAIKDEANQKVYYQKIWNNLRWKFLFKIFFSRFVMGRFGRSPQMMKEVQVPVNEFIYNKAAAHLSGIYCQQNPYLEFILTGNFGLRLPHYLRPENFENIKKNLDKIELRRDAIENVADESCHYMNLSNIFEYMEQQDFADIAGRISKNIMADGNVVYWNLMVPRRMSALADSGFEFDKTRSDLLHDKDHCFFYSAFIIDKKL